jgi:hypothetical protein
MQSRTDFRKNEVSFCADVKSWAEALFAQHPDWPFSEANIEEYGRKSNKRQDLRILDRQHHTPILSGEVKMPGTQEGRSPYDPGLMQDAFLKADNIQSPYFFTWNVNTFVLFDRSRWDVPMIDRRVKAWDLGLRLTRPEECARPEVQAYIRDTFLPQFFVEFTQIVTGVKPEWGMLPDELFLHSLESHLDWPVTGTRDYMAMQCQKDRAFATRFQSWMASEMQWTFDPINPEDWRYALERASRTLCYVFTNRAIFYKAIQARWPGDLKNLSMPARLTDESATYSHFRRQFGDAVALTGDYEPVFYPDINDWAGSLIFASPQACQGWKGFFVNLEEYDFRKIPSDILGGIFQKLISPEERQKFGQFFTHQDIVDVINAFCIRRGGDVVFDPACGSGSFLVRAYHRKAWLSEQAKGGRRRQDHMKHHQDLLREIYGCDIALFPAHLATLNMAARQINDEENFPLIRRGNFFEVAETPDRFCSIPASRGDGEERPMRAIPLTQLDAVIGNPPYVRQELIDKRSNLKKMRDESKEDFERRRKNTKEHFQELISRLWPGLKLAGRSDLHCYFWPVAAAFLKEGGYFGFLTSSSWLDVEYGFALQGWILQNFKLIAVLESVDEPWFADARIKTAVAILQRCSDKDIRESNIVRFVRLQKPLAVILGEREHGDETARQIAVERLLKLIETSNGYEDDNLRIITVSQSRLWQEGVKAGKLLAKAGPDMDDTEDDDQEENEIEVDPIDHQPAVETWLSSSDQYAAGKWGRFLRAPDIYFRIMQDYGNRFVKLGEIAEIRRGITSGCDAFFMPRDVTEEVIAEVRKGLPWNDVGLLIPAKRTEVESGKVRIIRAGDNTLHPVESEYLRPEIHSLMQVDRPIVRAANTDRVVLWVDKELKDLSGTYVAKYIRWGAKQTFPSKKSKPVPVPERSTCASRPIWYDLTNVTTGVVFWPMAQKYRHIVPTNPDGLVCNHNLFYLKPSDLEKTEQIALCAVLNSTLVSLIKHFYGRYAGAEGTLKTEVVDVVLLDIPNPSGVSLSLSRRMEEALRSISQRDVTHMVEDEFLECHTLEHLRNLLKKPLSLPKELQQPDRQELDDSVLELIGVTDPQERKKLLSELYNRTVAYYRYQRTQDIQSMLNRVGGRRRLTAEDIAISIWDSLPDDHKSPNLLDWLKSLSVKTQPVNIPDGRAKPLGKGDMFSPGGVDFFQGKTRHSETYAHPDQAALVALLANLEIRGEVDVPTGEKDCQRWQKDISARLSDAHKRYDELAGSRTGTPALREAATALLMQWFIHGR